ncbi:MAG: dihydrolipoyl dehydrogenase [Gammaproteobacteria bacterium]
MSESTIVKVPDLGDFDAVEVIEVLVKPGDHLSPEDPLVTLETDKAAMDVPSPYAGRVIEVSVKVGDSVSAGDTLALVAVAASEPKIDAEPEATPDFEKTETLSAAAFTSTYTGNVDRKCELLVLGAGVAGYTSAFRAADLGMEVVMVERWPSLGGVCLNVGCIPSKALLHAAKVIDDAAAMKEHGITFGEPEVNTKKLVKWKNSVIGKLTQGLTGLARRRKVTVAPGTGRFLSDHHVEVKSATGSQVIAFEKCIVAAGSEPVKLPFIPDDPRVIDSTGALELEELPKRMLVIGGGIIGLEMAAVYSALGVNISVVELTNQLIPGCDADLVKPLHQHIGKRYENIWLNTKVTLVESKLDGLEVTFEKNDDRFVETFGRVLVAVGRRPNGALIEAENAGVTVDERGFIPSNNHMQTNVPHIYSIGDVRGNPMLAHKGSHEGKVAAECAHGLKRAFDARVIPSVAYTDPEVAWVGLTETDAKRDNIAYEKGAFPWAASGRALALGVDTGLTKLLFDPETHRVIGMGAVGPHAGDLVAEAALAIEMGCDAEDIGLTIHAHPTLSETVAMAAEMFDGSITDLIAPKRR